MTKRERRATVKQVVTRGYIGNPKDSSVLLIFMEKSAYLLILFLIGIAISGLWLSYDAIDYRSILLWAFFLVWCAYMSATLAKQSQG